MRAFVPCLAVFAVTTSLAYAEAPTADQMLAPAKVKAAAEHKAIFVHFGASWCGWCRRLEPLPHGLCECAAENLAIFSICRKCLQDCELQTLSCEVFLDLFSQYSLIMRPIPTPQGERTDPCGI